MYGVSVMHHQVCRYMLRLGRREARQNASRINSVIVGPVSVRVAEVNLGLRSDDLSSFTTTMSTLKRVLAPTGQKDKGKQDLPAHATKLKELTIGDKHGKTSEFVLTEDTLYVTRPSDRTYVYPRMLQR